MDVRDYEYIVAIADQGSITRAAEQLFITQPALTKFLQRIEKELGLSLFVRKGKQFILTEAGQKYVEVGHEILRLDRKLTEQLKQDGITQKKRIRLGFSMGRLYELMESVLPQFHSVHPDIQIIAMETTSRKQFEALQRKELDIAIVTNVEQRVGYTYLPVEKSYLALAVPEDDPLIALAEPMEGYPFPAIDRALLNSRRFIMLQANTNSGHLTRELFRRYDIRPNTVLELNDVRSAIDTVAQGIGASMFMSVAAGNRKVRFLSIKDIDVISQMVYLVYHNDLAMTKPVEYLISLLYRP